MEPNWHTLPDYLIESFPELETEIEESYLFWLDATPNPYPYFFLHEFLAPILIGDGRLTDLSARTKAGQILDLLLTSEDTDLSCAALTSILEMLRDEPELRSRAWPFLGDTAREWLARMECR